MATQAIRFVGPPGQTITLDVFTLASDTAEQSGLVCTEATNRKGLYTTANFTDTLAGRHYIVKKISSSAVGSDFVDMINADGTYDSESLITAAALGAADRVAVLSSGTYYERTLERGTATTLIPDKTIKQPGASTDLTNPATQRFGGSQQE